MKQLSLILILLICFSACKEKEASTTTNSETTKVEEVKSEKKETKSTDSNTPYEIKEACEMITIEELSEIMNWDASQVKKDQMLQLKNQRGVTMCYYTHQPNNEVVQLRFSWSRDKAIENKALINIYKNLVEKGNQGYTYQEIEGDGDQTLFGQTKARGNYEFYHLKERYGLALDADVSVTSTTANTEEISKERMFKILRKTKK